MTLAREAGRRKYLQSEALSAQRVLEELRRLAFADIGALYDEQGNIRPIHTLTREERASIAGLETVIKNAQAGDGHTDTVLKIKTWDKPRSLEMLAKHFKLLTDIVQVEGLEKVADRLAQARKKHAGTS